MSAGLASLPSPDTGTIEIGPLSIHAYGLMIALGVVAAVWLFGRRLEDKRIGTRDDANAIAVWAVLAGVIGSRLYHVITDWSKFEDDLGEIPKIWNGGLGIPGGLIGGIAVGVWMIKRRGLPVGTALNCAAPAIAVAQAIGRWGNYFNQELFGGPTTLPWGLEIDPAKRPIEYRTDPDVLFHPTFLYESLGNLALAGLLIWIDHRRRVRPGHLLGAYVVGYGVIRYLVEGLRIDEADEVLGLRWNQVMALIAIAGAGIYLIATRRRPLAADDAAAFSGETAAQLDAVAVDAEPVPDNVVTDVASSADDVSDDVEEWTGSGDRSDP